MELKDELKKFVEIFGRDGLDLGKVVLNHEELYKIDDDLDAFYKILDFKKVITIGGEMFINIQSYDNLPKAQEGWYKCKNKNDWFNDDKYWNVNWVVFGDRNGDAIFYDRTTKSIKGAINKSKIFQISNSLSTFFHILTEVMKMEEEEFQFETQTEDGEILPDFIEKTISTISRVLTEAEVEDFVEFFFG